MKVAVPLLLTYGLLLATFLLPIIDSTGAPYFDLTSGFATVSYWAAQSGGTIGAPIVGSLMLVLLVTRHGIPVARRTRER